MLFATTTKPLVASLVLLVAVTFAALPAQGSPPPQTATVTVSAGPSCTVTVKYTWSGFKGSDLRALYGYTVPLGGGATGAEVAESSPVTGTGTASQTFDVSDVGSNTYSGFGGLYATNGRLLKGSDVTSLRGALVAC